MGRRKRSETQGRFSWEFWFIFKPGQGRSEGCKKGRGRTSSALVTVRFVPLDTQLPSAGQYLWAEDITAPAKPPLCAKHTYYVVSAGSQRSADPCQVNCWWKREILQLNQPEEYRENT